MSFLKEVFSHDNFLIVGIVCFVVFLFYVVFIIEDIKEDALETTDHIEAVVDTLARTITVTLVDGSTEVINIIKSDSTALRELMNTGSQIQHELKQFGLDDSVHAEALANIVKDAGRALVKKMRADTTAHK